VPTSIQPRWLYFHINAPKSAICTRAEIRSVENINRAKAIQIARELDLSEEEIRNYFGGQELVGCYRLGKIDFPDREVTVEEIAAHMVYHPPQSFFVLSKAAKELLDQLCGFQKGVFATRETCRK
jgi:predicted transcriptional regulator